MRLSLGIAFLCALFFGSPTSAQTTQQIGSFKGSSPWSVCAYDENNICQPFLALPATGGGAYIPLANFPAIIPGILGYAGIGTGTVASLQFLPITVQVVCESSASYGFVGDGTTDNLTAWNAWSSAKTGSACLHFVAGTYIFSTAVSHTMPSGHVSTQLEGDGKGATKLLWPNSNGGITINYNGPLNSANTRDLSFVTSQGASSGIGLNYNQIGTCLGEAPTSYISNVLFMGADNTGSGGNDYWAAGYQISSVSNTIVDGVDYFANATSGVGASYQGASSMCQTINHHLNNSNFVAAGIAVQDGSNVSGLTLAHNQILNGTIGFFLPSGQENNSEININDGNSFQQSLGADISINSGTNNVTIANNYIGVAASQVGIIVNSTASPNYISGFTITGNTIVSPSNSGTFGIVLNGTASSGTSGTIDANNFTTLGQGINLGAATSNVVIGPGNAYQNVATPVSDSGTGNTNFSSLLELSQGVLCKTSGDGFTSTTTGCLGSVQSGALGGTGVANTGKTITLGGNLTTSGAFASTFTMTGGTAVTFPTSGTLATTSSINAALPSATTSQIYGGSGSAGQAAVLSTLPTAAFPALTGDVTTPGASLATTLATVNSNVGACGSATASSVITLNAKGLATACSPTTITPAIGSITGLAAGVATWLSIPTSANLAAALTDETGTGVAVFATSPLLVTPTIKGSSSGFTTLASANAGASNFTVTIPAATDTIDLIATTQTLTNKTISGSANTLSNIGNGSLTNSSITLGATSVSLGGTTGVSGTPISTLFLSSPNLAGTVAGTPTWGSSQAITLSTAAQPNITSLGTLTALSVSGQITMSGSPTYGIDFNSETPSAGVIRIGNNQSIIGRNFNNTADLTIMQLVNNNLNIGASGALAIITSETVFGALAIPQTDNATALGQAGNRFSNFYSVLGTFSGNVSVAGLIQPISPATMTCGSGCASVAGNPQKFVVTAGTAQTSITANFGITWPGGIVPTCTISSNSTASVVDISSTSTTAITFGASVALTGSTINVLCF